MLAKSVPTIPESAGMLYEPKWDGFRCLIFRSGADVELGSRNRKPLTPYFPEIVSEAAAQLPPRCVLDGELVIPTEVGLSFDRLSQRIHPAQSRIERLAKETPAAFVAFDLLCLDDLDLRSVPFASRRSALAELMESARPPFHLSPVSTDPAIAKRWFEEFEGLGFDGVMAKPGTGLYAENKRSQFKIKHSRELDCVAAGYRMHKSGNGVGSVLLGLNHGGQLQHLGVASSFSAQRQRELLDELAPFALAAEQLPSHPWADWGKAEAHTDGVRMPGAPNRWSGGKDHSWVPLNCELVATILYEQLTSGRLRHPAKLIRLRTDKDPAECTFDQVTTNAPDQFFEMFWTSGIGAGA